ncbi:hypothetical protein IRJ41_012298 [Triplophysa rosa]|uniref:Uncharacterized protein n=1 Tax=Triplophysa rosa TaxID=992332 RepID=A0A9W7T4Y1_TRIRA|nr:hypothetical protein IRJ41_012298 [Triplophysa rosa]
MAGFPEAAHAARSGILFNQSTGESGSFSLKDISQDGPSPDDTEGDYVMGPAIPAHITLTTDETTSAHPPAFEDACSKLGIPLPKMNTKTVRGFIRRQERLLNLQSTKIPSAAIWKTVSMSSTDLPPAPCQPSVLSPPEYPLIQYDRIPSKAATKVLKDERTS